MYCTYHHSYLTLYRTVIPELFGLRWASSYRYEHRDIVQVLQVEAHFHVRMIARLLARAAKHGDRLLSDKVFPSFAYDSSRVLLNYVARITDGDRAEAKKIWEKAVEAVQGNRRLLVKMTPLFPSSERFIRSYPRVKKNGVTATGYYRRTLAKRG